MSMTTRGIFTEGFAPATPFPLEVIFFVLIFNVKKLC